MNHKMHNGLGKRFFLNGMAMAAMSAITAAMFAACANIGTPSGGPRDEDPPIFVSSNPAPGSHNVNKEKIVLTFNELVNVKDAFSKVVVSPTSKSTPRVTSQGKKVTIEFDSLAPNTTYTIDFADAIEDNNESNKLQGFAYTFSTGESLDSLRIAGRVLSARALEPQKSMIVGVCANLEDSAFTSLPLLRVAKTDDRGRFVIRGLAPGKYRVVALDDKDNDYRYSNPEEDIAFYEMTVEPSTTLTTANDTVFNPLTGKLDTVTERKRTLFLPNDILLRSFNSEIRQQYLAKYERLDSTRVFLKFNTRSDSLPRINVMGRPELTSIGTLDASQKLDSLVWWLTPELMRTDSLQLAVSYTRSDQNLVKQAVTDTLNFYTRKLPAAKKGKKDSAKKAKISPADSIARITTRFNIPMGGAHDVHLPIFFETPAPLQRFDMTAVKLWQTEDSVYYPVKERYQVTRPDSLNPRKFSLDYPWDYGGKYKITIDSLAATDIYGKPTLPLEQEFTVKQASEYCSLLLHVTGIPGGMPAFVELLNPSDAVVRTAPVENQEAYFPFLAPGKYYARIIFDTNGNNEYDTGNYQLGIQPELAYYYPKVINLKKNWDKEENWALFDTPVDMMKPMAITKNKPEQNRRNRNATNSEETEEEDDYFDPTANPFDPNDNSKARRNQQRSSGSY